MLSVRCRVFSEDPAHLADDLQIVLAEVAGGDDSLRRRAGDVSALIADQAVAPLVGCRVGPDCDDRMDVQGRRMDELRKAREDRRAPLQLLDAAGHALTKVLAEE